MFIVIKKGEYLSMSESYKKELFKLGSVVVYGEQFNSQDELEEYFRQQTSTEVDNMTESLSSSKELMDRMDKIQ